MRRRLLLSLLLLLGVTGCNRVSLIGHSITGQATSWDGDGQPDRTASAPSGVVVDAASGRTIPQAQPVVGRATGSVIIIDLIVNDAQVAFGGDGWTAADAASLRSVINTPPPATCVVVVLPGYTSNVSAGFATQLALARADAQAIIAERGNTVAADWQTIVDAHPEYMDEDGYHLLTPYTTPAEDLANAAIGKLSPVDHTAAAARQDFYWGHTCG